MCVATHDRSEHAWCAGFRSAGLLALGVAWLVIGGAADAQPSAEESAYDRWTLAAGDVHRHAGTAYSLLAESRMKGDRKKCPHEYGPASALYTSAERGGYQWLNLSYHVGVGNIVKPDGTPHQLVGSADDPAYRWWTRSGREPITDDLYEQTIDPSPNGFPNHVSGGFVDPPYNEALSLSSAANAHTVDGKFVAFAGREFTTATFVPVGGRATEGGHKTAIFPGDTQSSCGISDDPASDRRCRSELDLYRWAHASDAILVQAHPGAKPALPAFHPKTAIGGFSDRYVQGIEVGRARRFEPTWEKGYQHALSLGHRLFPAYGSDQHRYGGDEPCSLGGPNRLAHGATVCWVGDISRAGITGAMRERRCYYSRSGTPELRFSVLGDDGREIAHMGGEAQRTDGKIRVHVTAVNFLANQRNEENLHRFDRLELVHVSDTLVKVVVTCRERARDECHCRRGDRNTPDRCEFRGELEVEAGALYPRIRETEREVPCSPNESVSKARCLSESPMLIGAPVLLR